mmetsp:Transcript_101698/g.263476  ORF Transcript_101698/g.263476 Transcript_101698/m.263476 type:complete len:351 (-) Transcript_101698:628-1680(-)
MIRATAINLRRPTKPPVHDRSNHGRLRGRRRPLEVILSLSHHVILGNYGEDGCRARLQHLLLFRTRSLCWTRRCSAFRQCILRASHWGDQAGERRARRQALSHAGDHSLPRQVVPAGRQAESILQPEDARPIRHFAAHIGHDGPRLRVRQHAPARYFTARRYKSRRTCPLDLWKHTGPQHGLDLLGVESLACHRPRDCEVHDPPHGEYIRRCAELGDVAAAAPDLRRHPRKCASHRLRPPRGEARQAEVQQLCLHRTAGPVAATAPAAASCRSRHLRAAPTALDQYVGGLEVSVDDAGLLSMEILQRRACVHQNAVAVQICYSRGLDEDVQARPRHQLQHDCKFAMLEVN